jgi:glycosyltransferase involved in cell wall biosynthesis
MLIKPRVLFIIGTLWGDNGITSHLTTLTKEIMKYGWEVGLASGLASGQEGAKEEAIRAIKRFESYGVKCFVVPFPELHLSAQNIAAAFKSVLRLDIAVRQFKPDVIHLHSLSACPYVKAMQVWHKIPFVSTCHLEPATNRLNLKLGSLVSKYLSTIFGDRVIAISSSIKNAFERMHVPPESIRLIYHGVENDHFRPPSLEERLKARETFGLSPKAKVICFVGRLDVAVKGHDVLIHALAQLRSEGIEAIALCAGQGHGIGENIVQTLATEAGVSDLVRLLGFADTRQVLWASDVLTLPSRREGFALVIVEAMLCGVVPVRTPAAGALDQIEDGIHGFIVPFDDSEALALRLKQLLENDELRTRMSVAAIESAQQKFTVEKMTRSIIALYEEAIKEYDFPVSRNSHP